ncbi:MAG: cysteine desulfurase [Sulfolobales archaeon]|nr:cysteine desulfurase [Sulfolobales archaeon]MCX8199000.1 cysteine desulfurase [Sulfolobales archaeon]MDW8169979.1 cysteine desulfurase family protein [Desulfurococcaceae archaeon]
MRDELLRVSSKVKELLKEHGWPAREVYFDLENSNWVPREVVEAILPFFNERGYGHPSVTHKPGWEALEEVYLTKELVAKTIGAADLDEISFTHSGTEANNLAILGFIAKKDNRRRGGKIVVSAVEHLSVIFPAEYASQLFGLKMQRVPVDEYGFVDPELFKYYVDRDTLLVSIQLVNHEVGSIQKLKELVDVAKSANPNVVFHTDAADAYSWIPIDVERLHVDMMTISSHKIHGPRGVGALYVRNEVLLEPPLKGQLSVEKLWPGVENVPLIAGFRKAIEISFKGFEHRVSYVKALRDKLMNGIVSGIPEVLVNGPLNKGRVANNVNVSFLRIEGEALTVELSLHGIYVSSGSACSSRILEPSHVLLAIGRKREEAHGSILFKLSQYHRESDVDYALETIPKAVERLRAISSWKSC